MKKFLCIAYLLFGFFVLINLLPNKTYATENNSSQEDIEKNLNDAIDNQLDKIDWDSLEDFLNQEDNAKFFDGSLFDVAKNILTGNFKIDAKTFLEFLIDILIVGFKDLLPILSSVAIICILSGIVSKTKSNLLNESMGTLINFFFFSIVILILLGNVWELLSSAKKVITRAAKASKNIYITLPFKNILWKKERKC